MLISNYSLPFCTCTNSGWHLTLQHMSATYNTGVWTEVHKGTSVRKSRRCVVSTGDVISSAVKDPFMQLFFRRSIPLSLTFKLLRGQRSGWNGVVLEPNNKLVDQETTQNVCVLRKTENHKEYMFGVSKCISYTFTSHNDSGHYFSSVVLVKWAHVLCGTANSVINWSRAGAVLLRAHAELSAQTFCFRAVLSRKAYCVCVWERDKRTKWKLSWMEAMESSFLCLFLHLQLLSIQDWMAFSGSLSLFLSLAVDQRSVGLSRCLVAQSFNLPFKES